MFIVKVLKRKDASSVIIAVVLASLISNFIFSGTYYWGSKLAHIGDSYKQNNFGSQQWRDMYLMPFISLILGIIVLEILIRLVICFHPYFVRKRK